MKKYIKSMAFFLIAIAVLLIIYFVIRGMKGVVGEDYVRGNSTAPAQRVYDYADVLTGSEEEKLEKLIAKREAQIGCDIVLVILNEPLASYAKAYEDVLGSLSESEYVMVYADNFYDEYAFGYNKPHGDGCVLVDNWDRSDSVYGYAYNWLSTSGRVESRFSTSMINHVIDDVNDRVNDDPYEAYKSYVNNIYSYMSSGKSASDRVVIPFYAIIIISAVVAVIYLIGNLTKNVGARTTASNTYVNGGKAKMTVMTDQFIRRSTTKRHIQRSSGGGGGGGGGHHTSAGGHSHGGGGGHH